MLVPSKEAQAAGRYALRHAYGMQLVAEGQPPRADEQERGPLGMHQEWLVKFYVAVRREMGLSRPDDVFLEPQRWLSFGPPVPK
jgi:hypothetical protein